jgi:hypothetical protein
MILAFVVWIIVASSLSALAWYNERQYKMTARELNNQELFLKRYAADLEKNRQECNQKQEDELAQLASKKAELVRYKQISLERLAEAQGIEDAAKNKIAVLQKQVNKLFCLTISA